MVEGRGRVPQRVVQKDHAANYSFANDMAVACVLSISA